MTDVVLVINAGSSSVKFAAFSELSQPVPVRLAHGQVDGIGDAARLRVWSHDGAVLEDQPMTLATDPEQKHDDALAQVFGWLARHAGDRHLLAVGHRVVHGGASFDRPVRVTPQVMQELTQLVSLAPLHQPHNLAAIRAIARQQPQVPQVACFDTAFHTTQSWVAQAFALPRSISAQGVRRYGFHGLSYEYIAGILPAHLGEAANGRVVVAHLGNGASMCAMHARKSVYSTMGFTALEGLMMGTRCGNIDPGVVLHLITQLGMSATAVEHLLYHDSGLLGVSGISGDMRTLQTSTSPEARAAIDLYVHRINHELGALAASLQGLDALVFTAGVGEHSALVRERVCQAAAWLGIEIDVQANQQGATQISAPGSRVSVWVIPTNEELMIALHTRLLLRPNA
jgi:acetate kinase